MPSPNNFTGPAIGIPVAEALGVFSNPPEVVVDAAGAEPDEPRPNSRRENAAAVHANGATAGASPEPPETNHDNKFRPTATPPAGAAAITGEGAAAGAVAPAAAITAATAEEGLTNGLTTGPTTAAAAAGRARRAAAAGEGPDSMTGTLTASGIETDASGQSPRRVAAICGAEPPRSLRDLESGAGADFAAAPRERPCDTGAGADCSDRPGRPDAGREVLRGAADPASADPLEPAEPVVSATATAGNTTTAAPTPNATANAPTRPTTVGRLLSAA